MAKKKSSSSDSSGCWYIILVLLCILYFFTRFPIIATLATIAIILLFVVYARRKKQKTEEESLGGEQTLETQKAESSSSVSATYPEVRLPSIQQESKLDITIPEEKDGAPLQYTYTVKISLLDEAALRHHHKNKEWYFIPKDIDGEMHLFLGDDDIAILNQREDMLRDWIRRKDPYIICFKNLSEKNGATAFIAFYKDKRKGNEWREQIVVALTSYKSSEKQDIIELMHPGEEVFLEEDETGVAVMVDGEPIGKLPQKYATRFIEEGIYAAFLEKTEYDDGGNNSNYKERPYIRIFWTTRAE